MAGDAVSMKGVAFTGEKLENKIIEFTRTPTDTGATPSYGAPLKVHKLAGDSQMCDVARSRYSVQRRGMWSLSHGPPRSTQRSRGTRLPFLMVQHDALGQL